MFEHICMCALCEPPKFKIIDLKQRFFFLICLLQLFCVVLLQRSDERVNFFQRLVLLREMVDFVTVELVEEAALCIHIEFDAVVQIW